MARIAQQFDEFMNELRAFFETKRDELDTLEEIDVEALLERIEKISSLKKRHGSIKEILEYRDKKLKELEKYENLSFEKSQLQKRFDELKSKIDSLSEELTKYRLDSLETLKVRVNYYLDMLYMSSVGFELKEIELNELGKDEVVVNFKEYRY